LRQLATAARQVQTQRGVSSVSYNDLVGPDKPINEIKPVAGENYSTLNFGQNVMAVSVTTANGTTVALDLSPTAVAGSATAPVATPTVPAVQAPGVGPHIAASTAEPTTSPTGASSPTSPVNQSDAANIATSSSPSPTGFTSSAGPTATGSAVAPATAPTGSIQPVDPALPIDPVQPTGRQPASPSYMIQGGDTWEKISTGTGVPVLQLKQLNPSILEGSALPAGQTIRVR
jgi:LysM repeat protein